MQGRRLKTYLAAISMLVSGSAGAAEEAAFIEQLRSTISTVKSGDSWEIRSRAAMELPSVIERLNPEKIDDQTLAELTALLDDPKRAPIGWIAGSIGMFGQRAKSALPKLKALESAELDLETRSVCRGASGVPTWWAVHVAIARIEGKKPLQELLMVQRCRNN